MEQQSLLVDSPALENNAQKAMSASDQHRVSKATAVCIGVLFVVGCAVSLVGDVTSSSNLRKSSKLDVLVLAEQSEITKMKAAVKMTRDMASHLQENLNDVKKASHEALDQINSWAEAEAVKANDQLRGYSDRMASAATDLTNLETDFKAWCFTQESLFSAFLMMVKKKLDTAEAGVPLDITTEHKLLNNVVTHGLDGVKDMLSKINNSQAEFAKLTRSAESMGKEIRQHKKELETKEAVGGIATIEAGALCVGGATGVALGAALTGGAGLLGAGIVAGACATVTTGGVATIVALAGQWADAFDEQIARARKLGAKANELADRAQTDYDHMSMIKAEMDTVDALNINDVGIFKQTVVPVVEDLVGFLHNSSQNTLLSPHVWD